MNCDRVLRGGGRCGLRSDHKGRCSSVTFTCDGCGEVRRGYPHAHGGWEGEIFGFCFLCSGLPAQARGRPDPDTFAAEVAAEREDEARAWSEDLREMEASGQ